MAVFTEITHTEALKVIEDFDLGDFVDFSPIKDGNENTNYYLTTSKGRWVFTLFERLKGNELPFYLTLCEELAKKIPEVVRPLRSRQGNLYETLQGKPYSIANCFIGENIVDMSVYECAAMGHLLGRMHQRALELTLKQENSRSLNWCASVAPNVAPKMPEASRINFLSEIDYQLKVREKPSYQLLPQAPCHCDLFRNNTLINNAGSQDAKIVGVFDFYFAATAPLLFDLAVTMNDWCVDIPTGKFKMREAQAFIKAYHEANPLKESDRLHWRDMLRAAALRFWTSRLVDYYKPRTATLINKQDPAQFERILNDRKTAELPWPD